MLSSVARGQNFGNPFEILNSIFLLYFFFIPESSVNYKKKDKYIKDESAWKKLQDLCSLGSAIPSACDIANLRIAWLHLNVAIKAHFEAWSYVGTNICITLQIVFVTSLFAAISELLSGKNLPLDLIVLVVASCNISFIVFNNGHRLSEKVSFIEGETIS